ncbi:MAG TPA: hypothetical protein VFL58_08995 [Gaiellaceae bacterium]|nr:hypothetical protein [Gaiellaceae bacterium]
MLNLAPLRRFADERGQSLVLALLVMTFLAVSLGTVMFFTAGNQRTANYQKTAQIATSLAEAGVNNGVSVLANPQNSCCLQTTWASGGTAVLPDNTASHPALQTTYASDGTRSSGCVAGQPCVKWWATPDSNPNGFFWTLHGQATVPNPTGPTAAPIVKTVSAQVRVEQPPPGNIPVGVWNSIYSPFGPTTGCDTTVAQGVSMGVPLYVGGNLCIQNGATINAPVYVGGYLFAANKQAQIGCLTTNGNGCATPAPVNSAHVGGYCQVQNSGLQVNPCKSEPVQGGQPDTNIWVKNPATWDPHGLPSDFTDPVTGQLITLPPICWGPGTCAGDPAGGWYSAASPGPLHPCQIASTATATTTTPPVFDNLINGETLPKWGPQEGQPGGSVPGTFNLTPTQSYTCKNPGQGELSWNATTRTLTVVGTIFIDGNVYATTSGQQPITYTGWGSCTESTPCDGVVYVSGTVNITSEKLCARLNVAGTDCDWSLYNATTNPNGWNPNAKLLAFLANYQGGQTGVAAGQGIVVGPTQTSFQGALFANYQINTGQGAATQGPLVSATQTVVTGQQFVGTFPSLHILPVSMAGPPKGYFVDPPTNFKYGS